LAGDDTVQFVILDESDPDSLMELDMDTIWHRDPLIPTALAELGRRRYLSKVLSSGHSFALRTGEKLEGFIIGSIPSWDSEFFGFDSYIIKNLRYDNPQNLGKMLDIMEERLHAWRVRYAYAKIPASDLVTIRAFENRGFTLADIRVTFNRKLLNEGPFPTAYRGLEFDMATGDDMEIIADISKAVFRFDRFHRDSNFPRELADEVYYQWVANGAKAGKDIVKCELDNKIVGFHMLYPEKMLEDTEPTPLSMADLMGVLPKYAGKGIGTGLFMNHFALAESTGCKTVISGLHGDNIISMRLHERVGFKCIHAEIGLRKWY
jgi:GNAT superfamily N-acetyltransferase